VTVHEPIWDDSSQIVEPFVAVNYTEDATRADHTFGTDTETQLYLPNGRRVTTLVITHTADLVTYGEERTVGDPGDELPGAKMTMQVDAVGTVTPTYKISMTAQIVLPFNTPTSSHDFQGIYGCSDISILNGPAEPVTTQAAAVTAFAGASGALDVDISALGTVNCDNGECACRYADPSLPTTSIGKYDTSSGGFVDHVGGNGADLKHGIMFQRVSTPPGAGVDDMAEKFRCATAGVSGGSAPAGGIRIGGGGSSPVRGSARLRTPTTPAPPVAHDTPGPTGGVPPVQVGPSTSGAGGSNTAPATPVPARPLTVAEVRETLESSVKEALARSIVAGESGDAVGATHWRVVADAYRSNLNAWNAQHPQEPQTLLDRLGQPQPKSAGDGGNGKPPVQRPAPAGGDEDHHVFPSFLGGRDDPTVRMPGFVHGELHDAFMRFLRARYPQMCPRAGNDGERIRHTFSRSERLRVTAEFYRRNAAKYPEAYRVFRESFPSYFD